MKNGWLDSMECYCYLRHVQGLLADWKTHCERRFGEPFEYYLISVRDQSRLHQCGKNVLPGTFLGYALLAGGIWKGNILSDRRRRRIGNMDAPEICPQRINAKKKC